MANGAAESCGRYGVEWRGVRAGGCAGLERRAQTDFDDHAVDRWGDVNDEEPRRKVDV